MRVNHSAKMCLHHNKNKTLQTLTQSSKNPLVKSLSSPKVLLPLSIKRDHMQLGSRSLPLQFLSRIAASYFPTSRGLHAFYALKWPVTMPSARVHQRMPATITNWLFSTVQLFHIAIWPFWALFNWNRRLIVHKWNREINPHHHRAYFQVTTQAATGGVTMHWSECFSVQKEMTIDNWAAYILVTKPES